MTVSTCLYEGKAKRIYQTDQVNELLVEYKDDATAFNGEKQAVLSGKGRLNNEISARLLAKLQEDGVPNHFIRKVSDREQLVQAVKIMPLEVVVRNVAAGSLAGRIGYEEGVKLKQPIIEFYYKDDDLGDPLLNRDHITELAMTDSETLDAIEEQALKVNTILSNYFLSKNIRLIDFKLEFGHTETAGQLILADEVSPDTCRLWDANTNEKLDKDVFRRDLADLPEVYEQLLHRLGDA
ncbi:phosphoribosylaminoimidazolesuccinocarboxamide synthase [Tuberibacillus sp. Marseille-P3662]|uniref:phosphoribosylaminoimidazolesuccinocarboxamide synthase n=1 Tax=Tuberibacillus sp. Marseille-P3662 TaxID=1965358 RepID=UPI000A1CDB52|nr:phosphoribosylaminoimidazolesuccinocarboxamide synthase [Tuberibacillus sp. Marseille-P3662]